MTERYRQTLFGPDVTAAQAMQGSTSYASTDALAAADHLTENEVAFIAARDSFYMATNGADGWPYLQHRGGAVGFVRVLSDTRLAVADFRGNRQYISLGNLSADPRASLFFMDYANRARLKLLGRISIASITDAPAVMAAIEDPKQRSRVERLLIIDIEAFDWNCPQYIEPRYTIANIEPAISRLQSRIADLEAEVAGLLGSG